jgi:hypothetical protein
MKLSEFIFNKLMDGARSGLAANRPPTEEDIESWIVEWYGKTFKQPNREGKPALPPLWLADWHPLIRPIHEQEACGIDEG